MVTLLYTVVRWAYYLEGLVPHMFDVCYHIGWRYLAVGLEQVPDCRLWVF